jgi:hypothetical protein
MGQPAYKRKQLQPAVDFRSSVRSGRIIRGLTKAGLGRREPQIAPPAPDAGRGVAKRRRERRAEVRRLQPSPTDPTNRPLQSNSEDTRPKTHETPRAFRWLKAAGPRANCVP